MLGYVKVHCVNLRSLNPVLGSNIGNGVNKHCMKLAEAKVSQASEMTQKHMTAILFVMVFHLSEGLTRYMCCH